MNPLAHTTQLPRAAPARVLACGAFLKNRACLMEGSQAHWSVLHGDLDNPTHREALQASVSDLLARASGPVQALAHDMHPDFYSTRLAQAVAAERGLPAIGVQHHHAHIGGVLAEQAPPVPASAPVIGLALDGMGLGPDGSAWGGEVLRVGSGYAAHHWQRLDHLAPLTQPGADAAAREPWRLAAAVLFALRRGAEIEARFAPQVGMPAAALLHRMLQQDLNCPRSSSAGRWFDAAAGALGISVRQSGEAEAAIALEALARDWLAEHPSFAVEATSLDLHGLVGELFALAPQGPAAVARGAAWFHCALASALAQRAIAAAGAHASRCVVLAGGCFANGVLRHRLSTTLQQAGLSVRVPQDAGFGDAGLALGQAWVAACTVAEQAHQPAAPELSLAH